MAVSTKQKNEAVDWRSYPITSYETAPPEGEFDGIYFTKASIKRGTTITYYGRTAKGTKWIVETIWTFRREKYGRVRSWLNDVRTNNDIIELRNDETGEVRTLKFEYLASSARYRIDEPPERLNGSSAPDGRSEHGEPEQRE